MSKYYVPQNALSEFIRLAIDSIGGKFDDVEDDQYQFNLQSFIQTDTDKNAWIDEAVEQVILELDSGLETILPREEILTSADWIEASSKTMAVVREGLGLREEALRLREEAIVSREQAVHYRELDASLQETSVVKQLEVMTEEGVEPDEVRRCKNPECNKVLPSHSKASYCTGAYGKCGKRYHYLRSKGEAV